VKRKICVRNTGKSLLGEKGERWGAQGAREKRGVGGESETRDRKRDHAI